MKRRFLLTGIVLAVPLLGGALLMHGIGSINWGEGAPNLDASSPTVSAATSRATPVADERLASVRTAVETAKVGATFVSATPVETKCSIESARTFGASDHFVCNITTSVTYELTTADIETDLPAVQRQLTSQGWGGWPSGNAPDTNLDVIAHDYWHNERVVSNNPAYTPGSLPSADQYNSADDMNIGNIDGGIYDFYPQLTVTFSGAEPTYSMTLRVAGEYIRAG